MEVSFRDGPLAPRRPSRLRLIEWLALVLLAIAAGEAALINYLYHHRTITMEVAQANASDDDDDDAVPIPVPTPEDPYADVGVVKIWPPDTPAIDAVCGLFDSICYTRI
jgi:hypothetical protein